MSRDYKAQYAAKLRDPRWQKKRLEIFLRDGWKCIGCLSEEKTLNVHHKKYIPGREPWEYDGIDLMTYCDECHHQYHANEIHLKGIPRSIPKIEFSLQTVSREQFRTVINGIAEINRTWFKEGEKLRAWLRANAGEYPSEAAIKVALFLQERSIK